MSGATPNLNRRSVLIGGALLATAGIAYGRMPHENTPLLGKTPLDQLIPRTIGTWKYETSTGLVLPPSDQLKEGIYNDLLTRVYTGPDDKVIMLLIAYCQSQEGALQVHRPEICYPASGLRIVSNESYALQVNAQKSIPAQFIVADGNARHEQLIYWTRVGSYFPRRWIEQREAVMASRLSGVIPDAILVRISTLDGDSASAIRTLDDFALKMFAMLDPATRKALIL